MQLSAIWAICGIFSQNSSAISEGKWGEKIEKAFHVQSDKFICYLNAEGLPCFDAGCPIPNSVQNTYLVQMTKISEGTISTRNWSRYLLVGKCFLKALPTLNVQQLWAEKMLAF